MRLLFSGVMVAGLLSSQLAAAQSAAQCARPAERSAFDVEELKSELMVTAISCKANERYNAFMNRYKGDIASQEKEINAYFAHAYGKQGQKQHDDYITQLANAQSQAGLKQGTAFCDERVAMFDEVMALQNAQDLSPYAEGKDLAVPAALVSCGPGSEKAEVRQASAHRAVSSHARKKS